mgnify:CR=1 FL=1
MQNHPLARQPAVYILANGKNGTLYIGVTMNLPERVWQHKTMSMLMALLPDMMCMIWFGMSFLRICLKRLPKKKR